MPRQKSTKRIDPDAAVEAYETTRKVFKPNGSPIISPRTAKSSVEGPIGPSPPPTSPSENEGTTQTQDTERDGQRRLEQERKISRPTGAQVWVQRLLATHHKNLQSLGLDPVEFPNTHLSLKQLEQLIGPVISMTSLMKVEHFGIHVPTPEIARTMNDVHYWKLWESDTIDIGIFFMPPNSVIPLHNHPNMSVVTRILYGSARVRSYDLVPHAELEDVRSDSSTEDEELDTKRDVKWAKVSRHGEFVGDSTMWLDPRRFNLHQIEASSENGCALLDIMVPPYDNANRDCHHFQVVEERELPGKNDRLVKLLESIKPDNHNEPSH